MITKAKLKRWLKALRSGEYEQTQRKLCDSQGRMCCPGVYYDVNVDDDWQQDSAGGWCAGQPGVRVCGTGTTSGLIPTSEIPKNDQYEFATWNDECSMSFDQIAGKLEYRYREMLS